MSKDLLLEIGTEELPAAFIPRALNTLEGFLKKSLESNRLAFKEIKTLGTPRRLTFIVEGLAEKQSDTKIEAKGPQKKAAYDEKGEPTGALKGFAKGQGVELKDIKVVSTDKGEYVYAIKQVKGEKTVKILPKLLGDIISQDYFPKSMRWGFYDISFARPVHWILSIYDGKTVNFNFGHIKSSNVTYGHRFLGAGKSSPKPIKIDGVKSYSKKLKDAYVIADPEERKKTILKGIEKSASAVKGKILADESLLDEVAFLVEYPVIVRGSFGEEFLSMPRDIIVNAMREHQRYFSVLGPKGELLPYFITVANTKAKDISVVRKGNERVLRARLNDAKFYFEQDVRKKLSDRVESLKGVVFQAKLGTSYEKVERFASLALSIGAMAGFSKAPDENEKASEFLSDSLNPASYDPKSIDPGLYAKYVIGRGAMLSKADLTSGVVGEFPKLQGIMGSVYARMNGEVPEVAASIYEHYLPQVSGGALPASVPGAIISIADKIDTITGCFAVGLIPTGAQDPYALRRQALGVIAIILDKNFTLKLDELIERSLDLLQPKLTRNRTEVKENVLEFFKERLKNQLLTQGLSFDSIDAVLSAPWYNIVDAVKRAKAIEGFKKNPACGNLVVAFKRVSNILKGQAITDSPEPSLFKEPQETELYRASIEVAPLIDEYWKKGDYAKVFETLASIKDMIDAFFDKVMVMAEDEAVKKNRLKLLNSVRNLYFRIADLSKLTA